ncbi:MAG: geranylgeranylglyceryl/heptaprenylglyceryl phosphate synthase [Reichenbachiella sp.]
MNLLRRIEEDKQKGKKSLAVLIDPDKVDDFEQLVDLLDLCATYKVDYLFVGGSLMTLDHFSKVIAIIKENSNIPVIIFPGSNIQIDAQADAILLLSLISGRNPDFLISQHVMAATTLKKSKLEVIPMGYMLINSGPATSASYISNTTPIPSDKADIAVCTAIAGEMLGLKTLYLEAGSGAKEPVPAEIISKVKVSVDLPIVVGGGLNTPEKIDTALKAGADIVVVGNAIEKDLHFLKTISKRIKDQNS